MSHTCCPYWLAGGSESLDDVVCAVGQNAERALSNETSRTKLCIAGLGDPIQGVPPTCSWAPTGDVTRGSDPAGRIAPDGPRTKRSTGNVCSRQSLFYAVRFGAVELDLLTI
jgi:hypothetical protein